MLFINKKRIEVIAVAEVHFETARCLIWRRVGVDKCGNKSCLICNNGYSKRDGVSLKMKKTLSKETYLKGLILGEPKDLMITNEIIIKEIFGKTTEEIDDLRKHREANKAAKKAGTAFVKLTTKENNILKQFTLLSSIVDYYGWFNSLDANIAYGPYHIAEILGMRSCTYCNRTYTITKKTRKTKSGKLMRPQFDHWFPKTKFPLLGLSFYNLIPSCSICNSSVKGRVEFTLASHTHPYVDDEINNIEFTFDYWNMIDKYKVNVSGISDDNPRNIKIDNSLAAFKLDEMYDGHHPELEDLVQLSKAYSPEYLESLKIAFPGANLTDEQIYRYAFGTELNYSNFHKRPMSKFKYDILKQLRIIKQKS